MSRKKKNSKVRGRYKRARITLTTPSGEILNTTMGELFNALRYGDARTYENAFVTPGEKERARAEDREMWIFRLRVEFPADV